MKKRKKLSSLFSTLTKFVVNNKAHSATKVSLFMKNYNRKLRIKMDIRRKKK